MRRAVDPNDRTGGSRLAASANYNWFLREDSVAQVHQRLLVSGVVIYMASAILTALTYHIGYGRPWAEWYAWAIAVSALVVLIFWSRGSIPPPRESLAVLWFANLSVTAIVFGFTSLFESMPGLAFLGANAIFMVIHHSPRVVMWHFAFTMAVTFAVIAGAVIEDKVSVLQIATRAIAFLPINIGVPLMMLPVIRVLRRDALGAFHDTLTGLYNRRGLFTRARDLCDPPTEVRVLVVDIDRFKSINDTSGHAAGDAVLVTVARTIESSAGDNSMVARVGGEEFAVVTTADGIATAQRIRTAVAAVSTTVTVSIGLAAGTLRVPERDLDDLLVTADNAMYRAKKLGGDQVCA